MNEVRLHRRAEKGLRGLSNIERRKALLAISRIAEGEWKDILSDRNLERLLGIGRQKRYSYRSSPRIRLIIRRLTENRIQIDDIVSYYTLQRYFNWREE